MTDTITIPVTFDQASFHEAMLTISDPAPKKGGGFSLLKGLVFGGIFGALVMIVIRLGLGFNPDGSHFLAASLGAAVILAIWYYGTYRLRSKVIGLAEAAAKANDPQTFVFTPTGLTLTAAHARSEITWAGIGTITQGKHATIIALGATTLPVPHRDLPQDLTPAGFAAQLTQWKTA